MLDQAQTQTPTHASQRLLAPHPVPARSSILTDRCPNQSLAKHNRKPMQLTENNHHRPKSIASFFRVFCNPRAFSDDARSISPASARRGKSSPFVATESRVSSRTESHAFSCPPQLGGRGTQRGICFSRNRTGWKILIASRPLLETDAND